MTGLDPKALVNNKCKDSRVGIINQYKCTLMLANVVVFLVGPLLTEFRIDRMAFGQPERTCLNIQHIPPL